MVEDADKESVKAERLAQSKLSLISSEKASALEGKKRRQQKFSENTERTDTSDTRGN